MIYRKLNPQGDYTLGEGRSQFLTNSEAVAQAIVTRLKLLLGEWWEDVNEGLPLWQSILGSSGSEQNLLSIDNIVQERISETEGVENIINYSRIYDGNNRSYKFSARINTIYSTEEITVEEEINF